MPATLQLPRRARRPKLFGPNGKPLSMGLYPSTRSAPNQYRYRPPISRDIRRDFTECDRRDMLTTSWQLFSQLGNLGSAITEKNQWAFGDSWEPHYTGTNPAWGLEATDFIKNQFFPNADRHGRHDWLTMLFLSGVAWDRDGDDLMVLTEDANGFPKVEIISGSRIQSGDASEGRVVGGPFDGSRISDGIVFNESGTPVAARVVGIDADGKQTQQEYSIGYGGRADLAYQAEWTEQGRGIPLIGRCSLDWMDLQDIDTFLKRGIKRASAVGLVHKNAEGEAAVGNEIITEEEVVDSTGTTRTVTFEELEGGESYYVRSSDGEDLTTIDFQNPHQNVEAFIARIERRAIKAVGWAYELIYLNESGRAATRLVVDLGNQAIWKQQRLGLRRTWRAVRYALAKAQKNGFLRRNPDPKDAYFAWDFGLPKPLSVDAGNDEQADRENLKIGSTNKAILAQKKGYFWRDIQRQRKAEILTIAQDAADIEASTGGKIKFETALEMLEQRSPNPQSQAAPEPAPMQDAPPA